MSTAELRNTLSILRRSGNWVEGAERITRTFFGAAVEKHPQLDNYKFTIDPKAPNLLMWAQPEDKKDSFNKTNGISRMNVLFDKEGNGAQAQFMFLLNGRYNAYGNDIKVKFDICGSDAEAAATLIAAISKGDPSVYGSHPFNTYTLQVLRNSLVS